MNIEHLTNKIAFFLILLLHPNKPYSNISPRTKAVPT